MPTLRKALSSESGVFFWLHVAQFSGDCNVESAFLESCDSSCDLGFMDNYDSLCTVLQWNSYCRSKLLKATVDADWQTLRMMIRDLDGWKVNCQLRDVCVFLVIILSMTRQISVPVSPHSVLLMGCCSKWSSRVEFQLTLPQGLQFKIMELFACS